MAIALRSKASATANNAASLTIAKPTGTLDGDIMIACLSVGGGSGQTITPPAGWTLIRRDNQSTSTANASYWKLASGEGASYQFDNSPSSDICGGIASYTGVNTTAPVDISGGQVNSASTSATAPSVTTTVANTMLVGHFACTGNQTMTPPGGMTEEWDTNTGGTTKVTSEMSSEETFVGPGATGTRVATINASKANVCQLIALKVPGALTQAVAGTLTSSGVVSSIRIFLQSLAGALASAGVVVTQANKALSGALDSVGSVSKITSHSLQGSLSSSGAAAGVKLILKVVAGALSFAGSVLTSLFGAGLIILTVSDGSFSRVFRVLHGSYERVNMKAQSVRKTITGLTHVQEGAAWHEFRMTLQIFESDAGGSAYGTMANLLTLYELGNPTASPSTNLTYKDPTGTVWTVRFVSHAEIRPLAGVWVGTGGAPRQVAIVLEEV